MGHIFGNALMDSWCKSKVLSSSYHQQSEWI